MTLWRISNYADLKGLGGLQTAGRWHNRGIPVVYLAESPALAMLEVLVHFECAPDEVPTGYQLLEVEYAQRKGVSRLARSALGENWQDDINFTRSIGDEWLSAGHSTLLKTPSAFVPNSYNYVFNPRHPEAQVAIITTITTHPYDQRLLS
ncbi:MAG: RES family NAD+ phosphorylase [Pseudomonadales bacterium]